METTFHGMPARIIENNHLRLTCLAEAGPRIVGLSPAGIALNLFAEVPDLRIPTPSGDCRLYGGHRLWHAPEAFPRTYQPDNEGVEVTALPDGIRLTGPIETLTGIRKQIEVTLAPDRAAATVTHRLENLGIWPVELAPWAITQMRLGGLAVLPQTVGPLDPSGLLPNRQLVLWPYTRLADPRLRLYDDYVLVDAQSDQPAVKVGMMNRHGWLGYLLDGWFFVTRMTPQPDLPHPDFGCNAESYCGDSNIELETIGPLARLAPGQATSHVIRWELYAAADVPATIEGVRELVEGLGLVAA